jgi:hypothetical protein
MLLLEFGTQEALEIALSVLEQRASETDTASPEGWRVRGSIETIQAILTGKKGVVMTRALNKLERAIALLDIVDDSLRDYDKRLRPQDPSSRTVHDILSKLSDITTQLEQMGVGS